MVRLERTAPRVQPIVHPKFMCTLRRASLPSREYGFMMNSRQAMERLTAAAGKPGGLMVDVGQGHATSHQAGWWKSLDILNLEVAVSSTLEL